MYFTKISFCIQNLLLLFVSILGNESYFDIHEHGKLFNV